MRNTHSSVVVQPGAAQDTEIRAVAEGRYSAQAGTMSLGNLGLQGMLALGALVAMSAGLSGCVTVTDSHGNQQTLGQFVDGFRKIGQQPDAATAPGASAPAPAGATTTANGQQATPVAAGPVVVKTMNWAPGQPVPLDPTYSSGSGFFYKANPMLKVPAEVPGTNTSYFAAENGCRVMPTFFEDVDVDTSYARAMRKWHFSTPETVAARQQSSNGTNVAHKDWRHERQAGAFYRLAQEVYYPGPSQESRLLFMDMTLSKEGANRTRVDVIYCVRYLVDHFDVTADGHRYIQGVLRTAVKG